LERLRKEKKGSSTSLVLELIRHAEMERRRKATEKAISAYYDSLTEQEQREEAAWGQVALEQWKDEDS